MKKASIVLINGFEEIEALTTADILSRAGVEVDLISLENSLEVVGGHKISVNANKLLKDSDLSIYDILILPGGTKELDNHKELKEKILEFYKPEKYLAAICAAPMVLGSLGLLKGKEAVCYPGFEIFLEGAKISTKDVVKDGNIITARGPYFSIEFALKIIEIICGADKKEEISKHLLKDY